MNPSREKHGLLIVDDEVEILNSLRRIFRRQWHVFTADNAQNALEIVKNSSIAVVISDQRMPQMTGTEFLTQLKKVYPEIVTLLITGYADIQAVIDAINHGKVYRYITKPCDPRSLSAIIEQAMEKYALRQQNKELLLQLQKINAELEEKVAQRTQELQKANEHLQYLNKIKNEFLGMAAHDLRSPLSGVLSMSGILAESVEVPANKRVKWAKLMKISCENMLNLINNFLDVSKIESGTIQLSCEKINLYKFIEDVVSHNKTIANRDVDIHVELQENIPDVICDPHRIKQVCNNLLSNAYKFAAENSTIVLSMLHKGTHVEITVANNGKEISQLKLQQIFQPFSQLQEGRKHRHSAGLGLSICKKLIEMHGGQISATSCDGVTRFFFTLPLEEMTKNG